MATNNSIEGFFVDLGFNIDDKDLKVMSDNVRNATRVMGGLVSYITGPAALALGLFVTMTARSIDALGDFSEVEGVAIGSVQELGFAADVSGSSMEDMKSSIQGVNRVIGEAALGIGRGKALFKQLGLSARDENGNIRDFDSVLSVVADRMKGLSTQEAIALAEKLGINRSLIPLLRQGSDALEDLRIEARSFGLVTEEQADQANSLNMALTRWRWLLGSIKDTIALGLMPTMTKVVGELKQWFLENRQIITSGFSLAIRIFTGVLGQFWQWLRSIVSTLIDLVRWLLDFKIVVYALVAAMGIFISLQVARMFGAIAVQIGVAVKAMMALNAATVLMPALIGAIIIAVGLLIDDFLVWQAGGESLIGELLEGFPLVSDVVNGVSKAVNGVVFAFKEAFRAASDFAGFVSTEVQGALDLLGITGLFESNTLPSGMGQPIMNANPLLSSSGLLGSAAVASNLSNNSNQSTTIGEMNVSINSPDPRQAGSDLIRELEKQNISLIRNGQGQVVV